MSEKEVLDGLAKIDGLLSTLVKFKMAPILERELVNDFAQKLWSLTGKATAREIQKTLKCGPNRISAMWARWENSGLITKDGQSYRRIV